MELRDRSRDEAGIVIRAAADATGQQFVGHAAVFNVRTAIGNPLTWGFYEQVNAGAFAKTLKEGDARFLVDHDTSKLVARVSAGDLRLSEDDLGLAVDSDLDSEVSYVRDLVRNVEKRRITGMSFGFQVVKDDWTTEEVETNDGNAAEVEVRTIQEVRLFEVSAVTFPAYEETDAALRALALRDDPDPLGRRAHLIDRITAKQHEPGGSTRAPKDTEPAAATRMSLTQADALMQGLAARYGLSHIKS
jgi:HK97 family phage prohead protease